MSRSVRSLERGIQRCRRCERHGSRRHAVAGEGPAQAQIVLLGEAPGREEDRTGRPFVGRAGAYLDRMLARYGLERRSIYITSILKCRHPSRPRQPQIRRCRPWTLRQIGALRPRYLLVMGRTAQRALEEIIRDEQSNEGAGIMRQITTVATSHPAAAMRFPDQDRRFQRHMRTFARLVE